MSATCYQPFPGEKYWTETGGAFFLEKIRKRFLESKESTLDEDEDT